jgi:hypothetical protein
VLLLWLVATISLSYTDALSAASTSCLISSPDTSLADATCALDDAGNLTGAFTAPEPPVASPAPGTCQTFAGGNQSCTSQITVSACADASLALCASAPFDIETNIVGAPRSPPPTMARTIAEVLPCLGTCRHYKEVGHRQLAIAVESSAGAPVLTLDPSVAAPGTSVTVTGTGFIAPPPTSNPPTSNPPTSNPPTSNPPTSNPPTSNPPTSNPPTSNPPTFPQPTISVPNSQAPPNTILVPGILVAVLIAITLAAVLLLRRRRTAAPSGAPFPPPGHVQTRLRGSPRPSPAMQNTAGRPAGIVRIEVRRQAAKPRIEKETRQ